MELPKYCGTCATFSDMKRTKDTVVGKCAKNGKRKTALDKCDDWKTFLKEGKDER